MPSVPFAEGFLYKITIKFCLIYAMLQNVKNLKNCVDFMRFSSYNALEIYTFYIGG